MSKTINQLSPPALPDIILERTEVNKFIENALKKEVLFLHAPAGFGKTIAMSMWLAKNKMPCAWIPLTEYDDDPSVFCSYFLKALAAFDGDTANSVKTVLDDPGFETAPFEYLFRMVSSTLKNTSEGIIVLDDFHLIENESILKAFPIIIRKLTPMYKFVILSRLHPPATFADLIVKGHIGEINENDLRFTKQQIISLYKRFGILLSQNDASEIEAKTGGWALGLGARLLSVKAEGPHNLFYQISGEQYINDYLKNEIWDKWDDDTKEFLMRTSILEDLPPMLCDKLCGSGSEERLLKLMNSSGLVMRLSDGSYRYHHILRDFLRGIAAERKINLSRFYIVSADYMSENGKYKVALDYYDKSGDFNALSRFFFRVADYGIANDSVEGFCEAINDLLIKKLPADMIENNALILAPCVWASLILGNIDRFKIWLAKLMPYFSDANVGPRLRAAFLLFQFSNPFNSAQDVLNYAVKEIDVMSYGSPPSPTITDNFPFFHRSHRDYSYIANEWEEYVPKYIAAFNAVSGGIAAFVLTGVVCGILYEQNKLAAARKYALKLMDGLDENSHAELLFSSYMHLAVIAFAEFDEKSAWDAIYMAQSIIDKKALYLKKNINAMITKFQLYKGNMEAARDWLSGYTVNENSTVKYYQIYHTLTIIRAKIAVGEFASVLSLMSNVEKLVTDYRRPLDQIEILILRAILLWKEKQRAEAINNLEKAVLLAKPYGYIRIFANEGATVIPILQKLYNRYSIKSENRSILNFIRELIFISSEYAEQNPGITSSLEEKPIKLSKQQKLMLSLLAVGKNNRQICEETGLKLNTVKAHLFQLYGKLEVNNSTDAVLKAYRVGLLEKQKGILQNGDLVSHKTVIE